MEEILEQFDRRFKELIEQNIRQDILNNLGRIKDNAEVKIDINVEIKDETIEAIKKSFVKMFFNDTLATQRILKGHVARIIKNIEEQYKKNQQEIIKTVAIMEKYGFKPLSNGILYREEPVFLEKVTDGRHTFELPDEMKETFYVEKIYVHPYPFRVLATGKHPHLFSDGNFCTGDIKSFTDFAKPESLETIFSVAYIYSFANNACDEIKDFFYKKKSELKEKDEDRRGW